MRQLMKMRRKTSMRKALPSAAALAALFFCHCGTALAQNKPDDGLAVGRQMLAEDNPGELWAQRGEKLFYEKRGPKNASLERCDFGLGPGKLDGAFARLPRYFPDTDKVQDMESRLLTCMVELQGFKREDIIKNAFGTL